MTSELNMLFWNNGLVNTFKNSIVNSFDERKNLIGAKDNRSFSSENIFKKIFENNVFKNENKSYNTQNSIYNSLLQSKGLEKIKEKDVFREIVFDSKIREKEKSFLNEKVLGSSEKFVNENNSYFDKQSEFNSIEKEKASEIRKDVFREQMGNNLTDIKLDMSGMSNSINNEMDIDFVVKKLTEKIENALITSAEGVHDSV